MTEVQRLIAEECDSIKNLLIAKNKAYGNSFAEPINIFSKSTAEEQVNVRIDDKLNRIAKGSEKEAVPEDTEMDLIGYLILKRVLRKPRKAAISNVRDLDYCTEWGKDGKAE
jgi:hypothetical protein